MNYRSSDSRSCRCAVWVLLALVLSTGCTGPSSTRPTMVVPPPKAQPSDPAQPAQTLRMSPQLNSTGSRVKTQIRPREPVGAVEAQTTPLTDTSSALFFAASSADVTPEGRRLIQTLAARLKENRRVTVTLTGHSDDTGSAEFDIAMAQRRVDATANEFQKAGVLSRQIRRISYGNEARKTAPCATELCRQHERRVDLVIDG